ncbi:MAG TPA: tetratricopeptide repeat protein [Blastocatellia bacterium]|nr:tetratricopeptide repeat protein [Blastocatellia bacterium]
MSGPDLFKSPYIGLVPYSEDYWPFFFGRESERDIIIENIRGARLTLLYGPSGVGKTSVLHAGVVHRLRELAREAASNGSEQKLFVVVFKSWADNPLDQLRKIIQETFADSLNRDSALPGSSARTLYELLQSCTQGVEARVYIILDQFEEYFRYNSKANGEERFVKEFAEAVNKCSRRVSFLISIREDSYAKLDRFEGIIPALFDNYLRIEHLDRDSARAAIEKPIDKYNDLHRADGQQIQLGEGLVEEVLNQIPISRQSTRSAGKAYRKQESSETASRIETPRLQLVMARLWREEMSAGSRTLRLETLKRLRGADEIVRSYLNEGMSKLSRRQRALAAKVFLYLVTPTGEKQAYTVSSLANRTGANRERLIELLDRLRNDTLHPILNVSSQSSQGDPYYELSHDTLAPAVEAWRVQFIKKAKRKKRLIVSALALVLVLAATAMAAKFWEKEVARRQAEDAKRQAEVARHQAVVASTANNKFISEQHRIMLSGQTDYRTYINSTVENLFTLYEQEPDTISKGIILKNIAGLYRFFGEVSEAKGQYTDSRKYHKRAKKNYRKALELLEGALGDHPEVATTLNDLAGIYHNEGKYTKAEPLYAKALAVEEINLGEKDEYVIDGYKNLARCYIKVGKLVDAERLFTHVLELQTGGPDFPVVIDNLNELEKQIILDSLTDLGWLYDSLGKYDDAGKLLMKALEVQRSMSAPVGLPNYLNDLALDYYYKRGEYAEAESFFRDSLNILKGTPSPDPGEMAVSLNGLLASYNKQGKTADAEDSLEAENTYKMIVEGKLGVDAFSLERLAFLYDDQGRGGAEALFDQALNTYKANLKKGHPTVGRVLSNRGSFYYKRKDYQRSEADFKQALDSQEALPQSPELARTYYRLAKLYSDQGKYGDAEPLFNKAKEIQERSIPNHPDLATTKNDYAAMRMKM